MDRSDIRVCNTADLQTMTEHTRKAGLNRQLHSGLVLDSNGNHVLRLWIFGHQRGVLKDPLHHRVELLVKRRWDSEPYYQYFDVLDSDWAHLITWQEARKNDDRTLGVRV